MTHVLVLHPLLAQDGRDMVDLSQHPVKSRERLARTSLQAKIRECRGLEGLVHVIGRKSKGMEANVTSKNVTQKLNSNIQKEDTCRCLRLSSPLQHNSNQTKM